MISLKLDKNNNIIAGNDFFLVSEKEAVVQDVKSRLSMTQGEYPYNIKEGINYIDYMRSNDEEGLLNSIQQRLLEDKRIINVNFSINRDTHKLIIKLTLKSNKEISIEL